MPGPVDEGTELTGGSSVGADPGTPTVDVGRRGAVDGLSGASDRLVVTGPVSTPDASCQINTPAIIDPATTAQPDSTGSGSGSRR